jgi:hypothetical protein
MKIIADLSGICTLVGTVGYVVCPITNLLTMHNDLQQHGQNISALTVTNNITFS